MARGVGVGRSLFVRTGNTARARGAPRVCAMRRLPTGPTLYCASCSPQLLLSLVRQTASAHRHGAPSMGFLVRAAPSAHQQRTTERRRKGSISESDGHPLSAVSMGATGGLSRPDRTEGRRGSRRTQRKQRGIDTLPSLLDPVPPPLPALECPTASLAPQATSLARKNPEHGQSP